MNNIDTQAIIDALDKITKARAIEEGVDFIKATDEEIYKVAREVRAKYGIKQLASTQLVARMEKARMDEAMSFFICDEEDEDY